MEKKWDSCTAQMVQRSHVYNRQPQRNGYARNSTYKMNATLHCKRPALVPKIAELDEAKNEYTVEVAQTLHKLVKLNVCEPFLLNEVGTFITPQFLKFEIGNSYASER